MITRTVWFNAGRSRPEVIAHVARMENDEGWAVRQLLTLPGEHPQSRPEIVVVFEREPEAPAPVIVPQPTREELLLRAQQEAP